MRMRRAIRISFIEWAMQKGYLVTPNDEVRFWTYAGAQGFASDASAAGFCTAIEEEEYEGVSDQPWSQNGCHYGWRVSESAQ